MKGIPDTPAFFWSLLGVILILISGGLLFGPWFLFLAGCISVILGSMNYRSKR